MSDNEQIGIRIVRRIQSVIHANTAELNAFDRPIGDGDHGTNLDRGFTAVLAKIESQSDQSLAAVFKTTAMTLISTVGGAAGPLYGTAFLRISTAIPELDDDHPRQVAAALTAALGGVQARGKATTGEKTMVDALAPAVEASNAAVEEGADTVIVLERAATAARTGMEATIPMRATKGRASYLGERSIGHQDPGATSCYLIIQAVADVVRDGSTST
jgi:dihydroxyacetone kinase-like protein